MDTTGVKLAPTKTEVQVSPARTTVGLRSVPVETVFELLLAWQPYERLVVRGG